MKPSGALMIEHRLIEGMFELIGKEIERVNERQELDAVFLDAAVDFVRTYADRTHQGKEDILFARLAEKKLSAADSLMMEELAAEHRWVRETADRLADAKERYLRGEVQAFTAVADLLFELVRFFPSHMRKEEDVFFPEAERYFSRNQLDQLVAEFSNFDAGMIHEKYRSMIGSLAARYDL